MSYYSIGQKLRLKAVIKSFDFAKYGLRPGDTVRVTDAPIGRGWIATDSPVGRRLVCVRPDKFFEPVEEIPAPPQPACLDYPRPTPEPTAGRQLSPTTQELKPWLERFLDRWSPWRLRAQLEHLAVVQTRDAAREGERRLRLRKSTDHFYKRMRHYKNLNDEIQRVLNEQVRTIERLRATIAALTEKKPASKKRKRK